MSKAEIKHAELKKKKETPKMQPCNAKHLRAGDRIQFTLPRYLEDHSSEANRGIDRARCGEDVITGKVVSIAADGRVKLSDGRTFAAATIEQEALFREAS